MRKKIILAISTFIVLFLFLISLLILTKPATTLPVMTGSCCSKPTAICNAGKDDHPGYEYSAGKCSSLTYSSKPVSDSNKSGKKLAY